MGMGMERGRGRGRGRGRTVFRVDNKISDLDTTITDGVYMYCWRLRFRESTLWMGMYICT